MAQITLFHLRMGSDVDRRVYRESGIIQQEITLFSNVMNGNVEGERGWAEWKKYDINMLLSGRICFKGWCVFFFCHFFLGRKRKHK